MNLFEVNLNSFTILSRLNLLVLMTSNVPSIKLALALFKLAVVSLEILN